MVKLPPELNTMPLVFTSPVPSSTTPMILILSVAPALMVIAALPLNGAIEAQPCPSMLTGPVMVSEP
jgi:hypothetical protein